jgi:hypothetical protein
MHAIVTDTLKQPIADADVFIRDSINTTAGPKIPIFGTPSTSYSSRASNFPQSTTASRSANPHDE